jgi:hypothetical protein
MTGKYLLLMLLAAAAFAQDPVSITPYQLLDARSGQAVACSGCSIYTYAAGTTTPLATYTSSTLATPNTNPVLTNSAGYAVNGATITGIWVGSSCYKFVAKDATAVTLFTQDNICDRGAVLKALLAGSGGAALVGYTYPNSGFNRTVQVRLQESSAISVKDFGAVGNGTTDDAAAVIAAIAAANPSKCYVYFPAATYRISSLGTLSQVCTLDFGNSIILPDTTGVWLTVPVNTDNGERVIFKDGTFKQYASVVPTDIFKLMGQPDTLFENISYYVVHVSHSLVWNYSVYGTTFRGGKWVFNTVDAGVNNALLYASSAAAGDFSTFTIHMSMDAVDMSNNTGRCVGLEGGDFSFTNTIIEGCTLGGIEHVEDKWFIDHMLVDNLYMEGNGVFNFKFPKSSGNPNVSVSTNITINSSVFTANPSDTILLLGEHTILNFTNNISGNGCIGSSFSTTIGAVYAAGNTLYGNTAGCSANHQYLFKTAVDAFMPVTGYGSIQAVGMYPWTQSLNPSELKSLDTTAGAHIANFQDNANAIKAHVTIEGDVVAARDVAPVRDVLAGQDVSVSRYLILKGAGGVHNWGCQTANYTSADDLICYYDGNVRFKIANDGSVAFGVSPSMNLNLNSPLSTGALGAYANNAAALAGGLRVGDYYRTGADPDLVAQVH